MASPMSLAPPPSLPLTCAVLWHSPPQGSAEPGHFDLLLEPPQPLPAPDAGRLWTARLLLAPADWAAAESFPLTETAPHRRVYLTYEGPVPGGRGEVKRVDGGTARALAWDANGMVLAMDLRQFQGRLTCRRLHGDQWRAQIGNIP